jgi:hypothetical protein
MKDFYKASIMGLFSHVKFIKDELKTINGQTFAVFEYIADTKDEGAVFTKKAAATYGYSMYTIVNDNVLVVSFSAPLQSRSEWEETVAEMMGSIKLNKAEAFVER